MQVRGSTEDPSPPKGKREEGGVQQTRLNNMLGCTCMASGITLNLSEWVSNMWYCSRGQYGDWERGKPEILLLRLCYCSVNEGERCIYVSGSLCNMREGCLTSAHSTKYIFVSWTVVQNSASNLCAQVRHREIHYGHENSEFDQIIKTTTHRPRSACLKSSVTIQVYTQFLLVSWKFKIVSHLSLLVIQSIALKIMTWMWHIFLHVSFLPSS